MKGENVESVRERKNVTSLTNYKADDEIRRKNGCN